MARDPRALNRFPPEARVLHDKLEAWAAWCNTKPRDSADVVNAEMDDAVGCLPSDERQLMQLFYVSGGTAESIALKLAITLRESIKRLRLARERVGWTLAIWAAFGRGNPLERGFKPLRPANTDERTAARRIVNGPGRYANGG